MSEELRAGEGCWLFVMRRCCLFGESGQSVLRSVENSSVLLIMVSILQLDLM